MGCAVTTIGFVLVAIVVWVAMVAGVIYSGYSAYVSFEESRMVAAFLWGVLCLFLVTCLFSGATGRSS